MQDQLESQFDTNLAQPFVARQLQVASHDETDAVTTSAVLTAEDVDAIGKELEALPERKEFDVKAQLARLRPTLLKLKKKGYDATAIVELLKARGIQTSISSVARAIAIMPATKRQPAA